MTCINREMVQVFLAVNGESMNYQNGKENLNHVTIFYESKFYYDVGPTRDGHFVRSVPRSERIGNLEICLGIR